MKSSITIIFLLFTFAVYSQEYGSFIDSRDGKEYKIVKIGDQTWMAENLAFLPDTVFRYSKGSNVPEYYVYGDKDFDLFTIGINTTFNIESGPATKLREKEHYKAYGVLYNWKAANISCPSGWHLPSKDEWELLINYLGGTKVAGEKMKGSEIGSVRWRKGATNESGFNAKPGGYSYQDGSARVIGWYANFWSSTPASKKEKEAWRCYLDHKKKKAYINEWNKTEGYSVRCIKDE
ncbi:MAG: hypothetical protein K9H12_03825 [Bacteroidales bacterium]|nr:hypothetical protein [Bacteroidales bacterium]